jgi:hypothetical protein
MHSSLMKAPPNKRLKLTAPGLGTNCVCAPAGSVVLSIVAAPDAGRRRSLSAIR